MTFRDTNEKFELRGDLLKMLTNTKYNVDIAKASHEKLFYDFGKQMHFDEKALGKKILGDGSFKKLLKSTDIMASRISTIYSPSNPNELCDKLKVLLQEKRIGTSSFFDEDTVAIADKITEYRCISTKQHKLLQSKSLN